MGLGRLLKSALAHKLRLAHTAVAVALAVSLVAGTFALSDAIEAAFHQAAVSFPSGVAVVVRSAMAFDPQGTSLPQRDPLPESLVATVAKLPGVKAAWGSVSGYAEIVGADGKAAAGSSNLPPIGASWSPGDPLVAGQAPSGPDDVVIDQTTAKANNLTLGDRIKVVFAETVKEFVVRGIRAPGNSISASVASFDLGTTQTVLGETGKVDAVSVQAAPGVNPDVLRSRIAGALPDKYEAITDADAARQAEKSWTKALSFLTTGLVIFAGIALLVSAFIIFNTFSIIITQRTRDLGLLRAIGASRAQVRLSVLVEALAVGLAGSIGGLAGGWVAAWGLLFSLRATGFDLPPTRVTFSLGMLAAAVVSGVAVTVLAAALPARRATEVTAVDTIRKASGEEPAGLGRRTVAGIAVLAAGAAAVVTGVRNLVPRPLLFVASGSVAVLVGVALLTAVLARPLASVMSGPFTRLLGEPARLGRDNATRNPRRTAASATALTIGTGLVGVVAIMGASMRASASRTVEETLRADYVVTADGSAGVPTQAADRLRQVGGVQLVSPVKGGQFGLDGKTMTLLAVDPSTVTAMYVMDDAAAATVRSLDDKGILVRDTVAARHKWKVGDSVTLTFAKTGATKMKVEGTFSSPSVRTDYMVTVGAYAANYAQQFDLQVSVQLTPGTPAALGRARLEKAVADLPGVHVLDRSQALRQQRDQVQRYLIALTAILALSVLIALLGIANTVALAVHERTRELGLLRAVGMGRRQLRAMVRFEAAVIAGLGAVLGGVVAVGLGWALVTALRGQGVTELVLPYRELLAGMMVAVAAGLVAATLPARRAANLDVLDAVNS